MKKLLGWIFIFAASYLVYLWQPEFFQQAYGYIEHGDIASLAEYLRSFGVWSVIVVLVLFVVMTFTIVFPFFILSGAAAIMYGVFWGTIISWAGEVIGAQFMFVFARYFFRNTVATWVSHSRYLKQVDDYSAENGFKALLVARLLPLAPSGIITAVAAISRISYQDFFLATLIGKLPPVVVKVIMGHDVAYASQNKERLITLAVGVALLYAIYWWWNRKKQQSCE